MRRLLVSCVLALALGSLAGCGGSSVLGSGSSGSSTSSFALSALNGQYAFVLSGFDSSNNPIAMAGSFKANGAGQITGGAVDVNDNGTVYSSTALAGTYSFDQMTGTALPLGRIALTNSVTTPGGTALPHTLAFGFSVQASGAAGTVGLGDIMDLSANNFVIAGTLEFQTTADFSYSALAGNWVLELNGRTGTSGSLTNQTAALGRFTLPSNSTTGATNIVAFDRSVSGLNAATPAATAATVTFTTAPDPSNGRGTLTVVNNDGLASATQTFAYYVINNANPGRFVAVEDDANGTMIADAAVQGALTASSVNTTGAVFGMAGFDTTVSNEISAVGQFQIAASSNPPATLAVDSDDNGALVTGAAPGVTAVGFDSTVNIGRGTISVASGASNGLANNLVFYLTSPGNGFILDATPSSSNRAMVGPLYAQTTTSFAGGTSIVRARASAVKDATLNTGVIGSLAGLFLPISGSSPTQYQFLYDEGALTAGGPGTDLNAYPYTLTSPNGTTGRGTLTNTSNNETFVFYTISSNRFVLLYITQSANFASPVFFADQE